MAVLESDKTCSATNAICFIEWLRQEMDWNRMTESVTTNFIAVAKSSQTAWRDNCLSKPSMAANIKAVLHLHEPPDIERESVCFVFMLRWFDACHNKRCLGTSVRNERATSNWLLIWMGSKHLPSATPTECKENQCMTCIQLLALEVPVFGIKHICIQVYHNITSLVSSALALIMWTNFEFGIGQSTFCRDMMRSRHWTFPRYWSFVKLISGRIYRNSLSGFGE